MPLRPSPSSRSRGCPTTGRHPYPSRPAAERALARREAEGRAVHCKACAQWHAVVEHKRKKAIPRVSGKRRAEIRERRVVVEKIVEERGPECEAKVAGICTGWAEDPHEILSRGRCGSITDPDNIKGTCRACHNWIGAHPREAKALGLLRSARPDEARKVVPRPYTTVEGESK